MVKHATQEPESTPESARPTQPAGPTVVTHAVKDPDQKYAPDDWATFVVIPGSGGMRHAIQLKSTEEKEIQEPGMRAPRPVPVRGSGVLVRFTEGTFTTPEPGIIARLLEPADSPKWCGLGRDYDINRADPTGYWRKHFPNDFEVDETTVVRLKNKSEHIGVGPMTAGARSAVA